MFELSIAFKYLTPRWRQLSVSIISLISILVIALVVWLIVVFFSVTYGLERNWIDRLIALTAPVRILPTDAYYHSYYYQVDSVSSSSGYTHKSISEKRLAAKTDPYDATFDEELPANWGRPDLDEEGNLRDPVKIAFELLGDIPDIQARDYEMAMGNLKLNLLRHGVESNLSQATYLGSFDPDNRALKGALVKLSNEDLSHLFATSVDLNKFFERVTIQSLESPVGWILPKALYPQKGTWTVFVLYKEEQIHRLVLGKDQPSGYVKGQLLFTNGVLTLKVPGKEAVEVQQPLFVLDPLILNATAVPELAAKPQMVRFQVQAQIQGTLVKGEIPYGNLQIHQAEIKPQPLELTQDPIGGSGILLPRGFKDAGVLVGDRGSIVYYIPSASSIQEQSLPVVVAGFYDPGIIPIGGKFVIVPQEVTNLIRSAYAQDDAMQANGINVRFADLTRADKIKDELQNRFEVAGIAPYWNVETFREYDFTKDVIQQLRSEKNLFTLLATIIIIVACSNIISMLIILVNDKKVEIGILRSMGATSGSIALIFGTCGVVMGALGSAIGILAALLTLRHLQGLVNLLSRLQGHDLFNPIYYGETLPSALSWESIAFVIIATALISLISGLVPAIKASMMRPSAILRAE